MYSRHTQRKAKGEEKERGKEKKFKSNPLISTGSPVADHGNGSYQYQG
jgi:hypothetical protein